MIVQAQLPRKDLLWWINNLLCTNYSSLESASNGTYWSYVSLSYFVGAVECQLIDCIHPSISRITYFYHYR